MKTVFIYALKDPITNEIRYIGKSQDLKMRYRDHLRTKEKNHRTCWIRSLLSRGLRPILEVVDEVPFLEWPAVECAYIQYYREEGCDLVNGTAGGEDPPSWLGMKRSAEFCAKNRERLLGEKNHNYRKDFSPETRAKIGAAFRGKKQTQEHIAKKTAGRLGKKNSLKSREKVKNSMALVWEHRRQDKILLELWH